MRPTLRTEVEKLRKEKLEADMTVQELTRKLVEANQVIEDLKQKKAESDRLAMLYKGRLESLAPRIITVEKSLAQVLGVDVEELAGLVNKMQEQEKAAIEMKGKNCATVVPDEEGPSGSK